MNVFTDKKFLHFFLKFIALFCVLYYGTIAFIGITAPGGYYWPVADNFFNYVSALRWILMHFSKVVLEAAGYQVYLKDMYTIKLSNGTGVHIGYDCIGYGVMIFWTAFIFANEVGCINTLKWLSGGLLIIFFINVLRIVLLLIATNNNWISPFEFDNHTWFNIVAYLAIFTLIYFFDQSEKKRLKY